MVPSNTMKWAFRHMCMQSFISGGMSAVWVLVLLLNISTDIHIYSLISITLIVVAVTHSYMTLPELSCGATACSIYFYFTWFINSGKIEITMTSPQHMRHAPSISVYSYSCPQHVPDADLVSSAGIVGSCQISLSYSSPLGC